MKQKMKTENRFDILKNNPDLKLKDVEEQNVPDENLGQAKKQDENGPKITSFETFAQNIRAFDYEKSLLENYRAFARNSERVALPRECDRALYSIHYAYSQNEAKLLEKPNVMQSSAGFPFDFMKPESQSKLLNWKVDHKQMEECLAHSVNEILTIFHDGGQQQIGYALIYRLFIQLINKKNSGLLRNFIVKFINEFDCYAAITNYRYFNLIIWLFC